MSASNQEEKMLNLQVQMRQNQSELQSYLADLDDWESDIKKKEEQLKSGNTKDGALPPVRNTIDKKKLKKKKKEKPPTDPSKEKKRISGFDFRAWDKFDVDKALEEIDDNDKNDTKKDTSSSEYETDEEWEMERKKHLAGIEKDKGNKLLKQGDYDLAVEAYTKGMEFDATNAILPANRALALLKQQKFAAAELDCTTSISLDPLYVKAYLRRATARTGMSKLDEAVSDYRRVLDLESTNKQAKGELDVLEKQMARDKEGPVASSLTEDQRGIVKPIYKPVEERSKAPLKRIVIEEIGLEPAKWPQPTKQDQSEFAKKITAREGQEFDKLFTQSTSPPPRLPTPQQQQSSGSISSDLEHKKPESSTNISSEDLKMASRDLDNTFQEYKKTLGTNEMNGEHGEEQLDSFIISKHSPPKSSVPNLKLSLSSLSSSSEKTPSSNDKKSHQDLVNGEKREGIKSPSSAETVQSSGGGDRVGRSGSDGSGDGFSIPLTSFQLQSDFKLLKNKPESFFQYFQAIPPKQYPKLFGQCLDADILNAILKSLAAFSEKSDLNLYEVLHNLTLVKRFSMTAMFLSQRDKQVARELIQQLSSSGKYGDGDVSALRQKYDL